MSAILLAVEQQHIGQSTPPTHAAGVDPAFIPGLVPARPDQGAARETEQPESPETPETGAPADDSGPQDEAPRGEVAEREQQQDEGPVFEASDRRGAIVVDGSGIVFRLDTEEAQFGWDEIKAVEIDTPRFGRRFGVVVYTSPQRWFENDVEASNREQLKQWAAELDAVLDVRFDDGGDSGEAPAAGKAAKAVKAVEPEADDTSEAEAEAERAKNADSADSTDSADGVEKAEKAENAESTTDSKA
ncbi:hypothetical protein [Streptomyces clavuligerus]|uniref:hypothetical protein n=1 Tax=Streptomyces clavuligerus TaxID=1901 RepID=UPI00018516DC|nr:hypothetical protein [Streptomyces clavuligerus]